MLDLTSLKTARLINKPFRYSIIPHFLSQENSRVLLGNLPLHSNYRSLRDEGSDKTYNVVNNLLLKLGDKQPNPDSQMSEAWLTYVKTLQSSSYISTLSELLHEDLTSCYQEITLKRYGFNDYISPHTDKSHVRATHMIFLNENWEESWGGFLCFMKDCKTVFEKIKPAVEHSVAFVRSEESWHCVEPVVQPNAERIAVQVAFWNTSDRKILEGRIEHAIAS